MEEYGHTVESLTPEEEKVHIHVTLSILGINLVLFVSPISVLLLPLIIARLKIDKATLSYASILGIFEETGINNTQYNNLNTIFLIGKTNTSANLRIYLT